MVVKSKNEITNITTNNKKSKPDILSVFNNSIILILFFLFLLWKNPSMLYLLKMKLL